MKIKDLTIGDMCEITLVLVSATARETKAKKPFLTMEFFDGTDKIVGNYWDWTSGNIPPKNSILDIKAQVTEWSGAKQLNIKSLRISTDKILSDFAPTSRHNISDIYKDAWALVNEVKDDTLRTIGLAALEELSNAWLRIPGAVSVHHNYIGGTLIHSYSVAKIAKAIASQIKEANIELVVVGAMLHDIGKLFTYTIDGVTIEKTSQGRLYDHIVIGVNIIDDIANRHIFKTPSLHSINDAIDKVGLIKHIILSHHGKLEYGSPVSPQCIEAYIVHHADMLDATIEQIVSASGNEVWTNKLWTLSNSPHLTPNIVTSLMSVLE